MYICIFCVEKTQHCLLWFKCWIGGVLSLAYEYVCIVMWGLVEQYASNNFIAIFCAHGSKQLWLWLLLKWDHSSVKAVWDHSRNHNYSMLCFTLQSTYSIGFLPFIQRWIAEVGKLSSIKPLNLTPGCVKYYTCLALTGYLLVSI